MMFLGPFQAPNAQFRVQISKKNGDLCKPKNIKKKVLQVGGKYDFIERGRVGEKRFKN